MAPPRSTITGRSWRYFAASAATAALSLLTLPLTTLRLGPEDYGALALGSVLAGFGAALASLGLGYAIANRWAHATHEERTRLVSTLVGLTSAIAFAWAAIATLAFLALRDRMEFVAEVPTSGVLLLMVGLVLFPWSALATEILTIEGRATLFAWVTVAQAVATAAATLVSLFAFDAGRLSLFVGLASGAVVSFVVALPVVRPYVRRRFERIGRSELSPGAFLLAQVTETGQTFLERVLLARFAGLVELGLYTHSQRYRALAQQAAKAVGRSVWPVTLSEARQPNASFQATRRTWYAVHVAIVTTGLAVTALGDVLIDLLTNGKFTDAHVYLAPWFAYLLLQFAARPELGAIYALAPGRVAARISTVSNVIGIAAAAVLIPVFGAGGAVAALMLQLVALRILVRGPARRLRPIPFQDGWVLLGFVWLGAAWAVKLLLGPSLLGDLALLAVSVGSWLVVAAPVVRETLNTFAAGRAAPASS